VAVVLVATAAGGTTYPVGPSRTYKSPCDLASKVALQPGDVVEVDPGTYGDACQLAPSGSSSAPITLRGLPGPMPVFDATGIDLSGVGSIPRAIFQFTGGSYWVVQHLELKNAANGSANGAAFRATAGAHDILIEDVSIHDCQDGLMSDGVATVTIRASDIFHNGAGDGYSHNLYMQGESTTLLGNHIHDSAGGQNVKLRSRVTVLLYNRIENAGNYEIDLIQGPGTSQPNANAVLIGNIVIRPPASGNDSQVILFGTDNAAEPARNGSLYAVNNTFVLRNPSNRLLHANLPLAGSQIHFDNNLVEATVSGTALATDAATAAILAGSHNWIGSNITTAGALIQTVTGSDPGLVSASDVHLLPGSPAVDQGLSQPTYVDGAGAVQSAVPTDEFIDPVGISPRPSDGALDIGAYELATADGGTDAGPDAGSGLPDGGGSSPDAGSPPGGAVAGSCGCSAASGPVLPALLLAAAWFVRRRP
jgi:MYXO-CTERM domain-containing protein